MTEAEISQFTTMSVSALFPSPDNPRKHIDQAAIEQLAENIKEHGIISPLVVRPVLRVLTEYPHATHEIVSGERRWRAAQIAGLTHVPVRVLQLSDAAALEIQVIENLQRADIHELEEADGYKALQDRYGYTVEDLAAKVGKSVAYIYGRLKLCALQDETARRAFFAGTMAPTVALFIARLSPKLQKDATNLVMNGGWDQDTGQRAPYSTRDALRHLRSEYTLGLSSAPFATDSEDLVPAAGACTTCPKRSGNAPTLFAIETADVCTDPPCFAAKKKRHFARLVEDARAAGREVIEGKKAKEIFPSDYGGDPCAQGYVKLSDRELTYDGRDHKPWSVRLGKHCPTPTLVVHPKTQELHEVITVAQLRAAKKAAGIVAESSDDRPARESGSYAEEKKARAKEEAKRQERLDRAKEVAREALNQVCSAIETNRLVEQTEDALAFALAAHPSGRLALVDAGLLPEKDRQGTFEYDRVVAKAVEHRTFEYDRVVAKAVEHLRSSQLASLLVRAAVYGFDGPKAAPPGVLYTGEYSAELKALVGMFEEVSLKTLEKKATDARIRAAAVAEEGKKVDAALAASPKKPKKDSQAKRVPLSAPNTAMAAALVNAKQGKVKKATRASKEAAV